MSILDLIKKLSEAEEPSRKFDTAIGIALGFEPVEEQGSKRVVWLDPVSRTATKLPWFTRSLDESKELTDLLAPEKAVAVSWAADGSFRAQIEDGEASKGATGPLAICIAALSFYHLHNRQ